MYTVCQPDGTFSHLPPTCAPITCGPILNGTNTEPVPATVQGGLSYLETYTYSCIDGYDTKDELCAVCYPNGSLSIDHPPNCTEKACVVHVADIAFILDGSGSVSSSEWDQSIDFAVTAVQNYDIGRDQVRIALIVFGTRTTLVFDFNFYDNKVDVVAALRAAYKPGGGTYTNLALDMAKDDLFIESSGMRLGVPNILIVITDGQSSSSSSTAASAAALHSAGLTVVAVGIGRAPASEMEAIASSTNLVYHYQDYDMLVGLQEKFNSELCYGVGCGTPVNGTNTEDIPESLRRDGMSFMETYTYSCLEGYTTYDELCTVCLPNGTLSLAAPPTCTEIVCGTPGNGINTVGVRADIYLSYLQSYTYECLYGYSTFQMMTTVCQPDGTFSLAGNEPDCSAITCGPILNGANTEPVPATVQGGLSYLETYTYSCIDGYETKDELCAVCYPNGSLSIDHPPNCILPQKVWCPIPLNGSNTVPVTLRGPMSVMETYTYSCLEGYTTHGELCTVCLPNGTLSLAHPPTCTAITCGHPANGVNTVPVGRRAWLSYMEGYTYECEYGYTSDDVMYTVCQPDGTFSLAGNEPNCTAIACGPILNGTNTEHVPATVQGGLSYLETYTYSCIDGYETKDELCAVCYPNGSLSIHHPPNCTEKPEICAVRIADIAFVIDASGSVSSDQWDQGILFASSAVQSYDVGRGEVRVALIVFASRITLVFDFNQFDNKADVISALQAAAKPGGGTYTHLALDMALNELFQENRGMRLGVPNVLVVITDGHSSSPSSTAASATALHSAGVTVVAVGIGNAPISEMEAIASSTNLVYHYEDYDRLIDLQDTFHLEICQHVGCGAPINGNNTEYIPESLRREGMSFMQTYTYSCLEGYTTNDELCIVCLPNGTHSLATPPTCTEIVCGTPGNGINTVGVTADIYLSYLQTYTYECLYGYSTFQMMTTVCQPDGTFSLAGNEPDCSAITCGPILNGTNTEPVPATVQGGLSYLETYTYSCIDGYETKDELCAVCYPNGSLSIDHPPNCSESCVIKTADIGFVIDGSGSVSMDQWHQSILFATTAVNSYDVGADEVRIALIVFASRTTLVFDFNQYDNKADVISALQAAAKPGGGTNTHLALDMALSQLFQASSGMRVGVPNMLVVLTDGQSRSSSSTAASAAALHSAFITVVAVGIGNAPASEMQAIASSLNLVYHYHDYDMLVDLQQEFNLELCKDVGCGTPINGTNTEDIPDSLKHGMSFMETYTYSCLEGYTTYDELCTVCLPNGTLSLAAPPTCTEIVCGTPGNGINTVGVRADIYLSYLQSYTYECLYGYSTFQMMTTVCQPDGTFSLAGNEPDCSAITCGPILNGTNTEPVPATVQGGLSYLETYTYSCIDGYETKDELCAVCYPNGSLSIDRPPNCTEKSDVCIIHTADIAFVIDGSGSVDRKEWDQSIDFAVAAVQSYAIGRDQVRVALIVFGSSATPVFDFNQYDNRADVVAALRAAYKPGGGTSTHLALDMAKNDLFIESSGMRLGVPNMLIVITDGQSSSSSSTAASAAALHSAFITVVAVGIGNAPASEMEAIASSTTLIYHYHDYDMLVDLQDSFISTTCAPMACGTPINGINTEDIPDSLRRAGMSFMETYTYSCLEGYTTDDELCTVCLPNGTLSLSSPPNCTEIVCGLPANGVNTVSVDTTNWFSYLEGYTYECKYGYTSEDVMYTVCQPDGTFSLAGHEPNCTAITCGPILNGTNTEPVPATVQGGLSYLETYTYSCIDGYETKDELCAVCYPNGSLSIERPPNCTEKPEECTVMTADIAFVIDASSSVSSSQWDQSIQFASTAVNSYNIGRDEVRIALIVFASKPTLVFDFNFYDNKADVIAALRAAHKPGGGTYTHMALDRAKDDLFVESSGMRFTVPNLLIVITDGQSSRSSSTAASAAALHNAGITVVAVGIGNAPASEMEAIASSTNLVYHYHDYDMLVDPQNSFNLEICKGVACGPPINGTNTEDIPESLRREGMSFMQTYTYSCLEGYATDDELCTVCLPNGTLSLATPPICNPIRCPAPENGTNTLPIPASLASTGMSYLETYTYLCQYGFETFDEVCTVCLPDGTLSLKAPPNCTALCGAPLDGYMTKPAPQDLTAEIGGVYTYQCMDGHVPYHPYKGNMTTHCVANDVWSMHPPPSCTLECRTIPLLINRAIVPRTNCVSSYIHSDVLCIEPMEISCKTGDVFDLGTCRCIPRTGTFVCPIP